MSLAMAILSGGSQITRPFIRTGSPPMNLRASQRTSSPTKNRTKKATRVRAASGGARRPGGHRSLRVTAAAQATAASVTSSAPSMIANASSSCSAVMHSGGLVKTLSQCCMV